MIGTVIGFEEEMKRVGFRYRQPEELSDGKVVVTCGIEGVCARYDVYFFFDPDEHAVSIRIFNLLKAPIDRMPQVMDLINTLNGEYRWIKFFKDADCKVNVQADAIISPETSGKIAFEILARSMKIIDEIYPRFMKAIWADSAE